jgi:hypothetical protein
LNIADDTKAEMLLSFVRDLPYVEAQMDREPKKWNGNLSALDAPVSISNFKAFAREELHGR